MRIAALLVWTGVWLVTALIGVLLLGAIAARTTEGLLENMLVSDPSERVQPWEQ